MDNRGGNSKTRPLSTSDNEVNSSVDTTVDDMVHVMSPKRIKTDSEDSEYDFVERPTLAYQPRKMMIETPQTSVRRSIVASSSDVESVGDLSLTQVTIGDDANDLAFLKSHLEKPLVESETWVVVDRAWLAHFKSWLDKKTMVKPSAMSWTHLRSQSHTDLLKDELQLGESIDIVPLAMLQWLEDRIGCEPGEKPIIRRVVNTAPPDSIYANLLLELYPLLIYLYKLGNDDDNEVSDRSECRKMLLSKTDTVASLDELVVKELNRDSTYRLWRISGQPAHFEVATNDAGRFIAGDKPVVEIPADRASAIGDLNLPNSVSLLCEVQTDDSRLWPMDGVEASHASPISRQLLLAHNPYPSPEPPAANEEEQEEEDIGGSTGLSNLGNTCYMNSALQCLTHVEEIAKYFLSGAHSLELNVENPLGMQGQIANAFAGLMRNLYATPTKRSYSPMEFKRTLGRFAPSFSGYGQQDSQEFLAFLLDGLHEDLNRIVKKPYTEKPDAEDLNEIALAELADECWKLHKMRNDSIVVDLVQGQFKSTVVCPVCAKVGEKFEMLLKNRYL